MLNVDRCFLQNENRAVKRLVAIAELKSSERQIVTSMTEELIESVRSQDSKFSPLDRLLREYSLGTDEGSLLMCLAEAFLRVPDRSTAMELLVDKLGDINWAPHLNNDDLFVNSATWAMLLTGKILPDANPTTHERVTIFDQLLGRLGAPVVIAAVRQGMQIIGEQFVMGEEIGEAVKRASQDMRDFECYSFDMLGEAALTDEHAYAYYIAYEDAINRLAMHSKELALNGLGISLKLSALHPRFEISQRQASVDALVKRVIPLVELAAKQNLKCTIDAEESYRLSMTLAVVERVLAANSVNRELRSGEASFGIAVQAYQKRAPDVITALAELAKEAHVRLRVRLVKGAYWDSEIKLAQSLGLDNFPVYTRKYHTDISYLACARLLFDLQEYLEPAFATHNAHSMAYLDFIAEERAIEFQRLHGMGELLHEAIIAKSDKGHQSRIYAPVGTHEQLLPYLIRRLLENGANTSFVNRIADPACPVELLAADPIDKSREENFSPSGSIRLPADLFQPQRLNSQGTNFADLQELEKFLAATQSNSDVHINASSISNTALTTRNSEQRVSPADQSVVVGNVTELLAEDVAPMLKNIDSLDEDGKLNQTRLIDALEEVAVRLQANRCALISIIVRETGRTLLDADAEIREAIDFCRYYAAQARCLFRDPQVLRGPDGEHNTLTYRPIGTVVCISPWNFPMAIYVGQIAAALVTGNTVIAKPSEYATISAFAITRLFHQAGFPKSHLHLIAGDGPTVGALLVKHPSVNSVVFTGAFTTAKIIRQSIATAGGSPKRLIAETGGVNAMIVDSSALSEQVVHDALDSGFNSAGQRCSSLRVMYLQDDIADAIIEQLIGRMKLLNIGHPMSFDTDIGPLISHAAKEQFEIYLSDVESEGRVIYRLPLPKDLPKGHYVGPALVMVDHIDQVSDEIFAPIIHIRRFPIEQLSEVCNEVNSRDYALTCGIHSRINRRIDFLKSRIQAGNFYINRNMIGAVVGSQPFGGSRRSGTGPKAGGPNYLAAFTTEISISENTTAIGGNASLLNLDP